MNTDNLFEQIANISKANAYDIVSKHAQELKEENERLREDNKCMMMAIHAMRVELWETICSLNALSAQGRLNENGENRREFCKTLYNDTEQYSKQFFEFPNTDLGESFEKLKEDMRDEENENDDLKGVL